MSEADADTTRTGPGRTRATGRSRAARIVIYAVCGLLSVWLVGSVVVALANGLAHDSAVDPFTQQPVQSDRDEP